MTATVRSVRVVMEADVGGYIAQMRLAGRVTDESFSGATRSLGTTNTQLKSVDTSAAATTRTLAGTRAGVRGLDTDTARLGTTLGRTTGQLDTFTGRAGVMLKLAAGFGPALLPIGAIGVPALAALAAQGGFAAGAIGATVLALHGIGDGIKALEKAKLDPTVENVRAAQTELRRMGPELASLVLHLDDLTDARQKLQRSAAAGLVPGLNESLDDLETALPAARRLAREFGDITGDITARAAEDLTSGRWTEFYDYLRNNARPILDDTAAAVGNVAHGIASIFSATSRDQQGFTSWLRESTEDFDQWADRLEGNDDFQDFLAYARENGPQVAETVGSIATAFAAVVEAAAPLGGPTLQILESLADVLGAIADSPIGTELFTAISGYSLLSTVLPGVKKGYDGIAVGQAKFDGLIGKSRTGVTTFASDLRNVARYGSLATESSQRLRTQLGPLVKGGAGLAGLALATSGAADGLGLTNTMSLALIGTLAGPWGAAVGAAVGLVADFRAESKRAGQAQKDLDAVFSDSTSSYQERVDELASATDAYSSAYEGMVQKGQSLGGILQQTLLNPIETLNYDLSGLDGSTWVNDLKQASEEANAELDRTNDGLATIAVAFGNLDIFHSETGLSITPSVDDLAKVADRAAPAMAALGISLDDLANADPETLQEYAAAIVDYTTGSDTAAGRTAALDAAIAGLDNELLSTAVSASELKDNLDALLGPQLGLSAATDAWTAGIHQLDEDLAKHNRTLVGNSDAALKNRDVIRDRVGLLTDQLVAEANAGASSDQLARKLRSQRKALLDAGDAAGISRKQMRDYLNTLGLTPGLVKTLIQNNADQAKAKADSYYRSLISMDGTSIQTYIDVYRRTHGGTTQGQKDNPAIADGGTVPGERYPYADKVYAYVAPGEEIITNRHGEADRFRADRAAGRIPRYADGGTVGGGDDSPTGKPDPKDPKNKKNESALVSFAVAALLASDSLRELKQSSKELTKSEERLRTSRDSLQARYDEISSRTVSMFTSDLFAESEGSNNPWTAGGKAGVDPLAVLQGDIADLTKFEQLKAQLEARGLTGDALDAAAQGGVKGLEVIANYSDDQLAQFSALLGIRSSMATAAGSGLADSVVGPQLASANEKLDKVVDRLRDVEQAIKVADDGNREGHRARANQGAGADNSGFVKGKDDAAGRGRRRARRTSTS